MTQSYKLSENDFLQYQVFAASKSKVIRKQRVRTRLIITFGSFAAGLLFYLSHNKFLAVYFVLFGCFYFLLNVSRGNNFYEKHYRKYVRENYQKRFDQPAIVTINTDNIECSDITGLTRINLSQFEEITETKNYYFLKMGSGGHFIIPRSGFENAESVKEELQRIAKDYQIPFNVDPGF